MSPEVSKRLRLLASAVSVLVLLAVLTAGWFYWRVRASLPQLDGMVTLPGLAGAVTVARDTLGVPTIRGDTRGDVARALGWLHAQDRFFQMDLLRRSAAGELAELFGPRAVPRDRGARMHGFRRLATEILTRLPANERALIDTYVAGVNAGLAALRERPFEYVVLRSDPAAWRAEDTILVNFAMTLDLQDANAGYKRTLMTLRDQLGRETLAFFAPVAVPGDAALDGTTAPVAPIPGPKIINLRSPKVGAALRSRPASPPDFHPADSFPFPPRDPEAALGSNAIALAGAHTASGAALLAGDMHLTLGVPNTWYRASFEFAGKKITGVTLPGIPVMIAGSNGNVAWAFTVSFADTGDLIEVEINSLAHTLYKAPGHEDFLRIENRRETIRVKGADPVVADYAWTIWGPVIATNERNRPLAYRWTAHDAAATNLSLLEMESVTTTADGVAVAHRSGIPSVNIVLADRAGTIAWTVAGRLPKRVGYDGRLPVTWSFGDRKWAGYLTSEETPVILGDASTLPGRLWSANHRQVGGEALNRLGQGGAYRRAPRAAQIRDDLAPLARATPKDLLAVQLDDRALFLAPWHRLLTETLSPAATAADTSRAQLRTWAEKWEGRASIDAVSYRIVRAFRTAVHERVFPAIFASCLEAYPQFNRHELQLEDALWALLREKPLHLLNPAFANWDDLLLAAVDDTVRTLAKSGQPLPHGTWGEANRARIRHPFSYSFPVLASWLDMPADPLPGDHDMPRAQTPTHGASERFVVSPGHEQEGIFHMPGGQSGHPLSPYYRAGHRAWVRGEATPFLPGPAEHTLTLRP